MSKVERIKFLDNERDAIEDVVGVMTRFGLYCELMNDLDNDSESEEFTLIVSNDEALLAEEVQKWEEEHTTDD